MFALNQTEKLLLGICLLVPLLVIVNLGLWSAFRRRKDRASGSQMPMPRNLLDFRHPWREEDNGLRELSRRVEDLQHPTEPPDKDKRNSGS